MDLIYVIGHVEMLNTHTGYFFDAMTREGQA